MVNGKSGKGQGMSKEELKMMEMMFGSKPKK